MGPAHPPLLAISWLRTARLSQLGGGGRLLAQVHDQASLPEGPLPGLYQVANSPYCPDTGERLPICDDGRARSHLVFLRAVEGTATD